MNRTQKSLATCSTAAIGKTNPWLGYFCLAILFLSVVSQSGHALVTKRYAYVIDNAGGAVDEFSITPGTGALAPLVGCPVLPPLFKPTSGEVNPTGQFLYVADPGAAGGPGLIWVYSIIPIGPKQGCLTFVQALPTLAPPDSIGVDNSYVYVSEPGPGVIEGFPITPGTGVLGAAVPGSPFPAGPVPMGLAIDSAAPFLYVANDVAAGTITAFMRLPAGTLAPIGAFATGGFPTQVAVDPVEQFVFVIYPGFVESYPIIPGAGALGAPNIPVATGAAPMGLAVSQFGQLAFVSNSPAGKVSSHLVNNLTGQVSPPMPPLATGAGPMGATAEQQGKYLYVADNVAGLVSGYAINPVTGGLVAIAGSPWPAGIGPIAIATQP